MTVNGKKKRRQKRALVSAGAMLLATVGAAVAWFVLPVTRTGRLARLADADLVSQVARHPADADALLELARRMERQGLDGEARADYRRAADADPRRAAAAWSGVARLALKQGDTNAAREAALKAIETGPTDTRRLRNAGQVLNAVGDQNAARDVLEKAAALAPDDAATWDALAVVQTARGSLLEAVNAATRAARLAPGVARHWLHLATAQRLSANAAGADQAITQAARLAPDDPDILLELGTLRAQTARTPIEQQEAERALRKARDRLRGTAREIEPLRQLGQFYLGQGRLPDAQTILEDCLRIAPDDSIARFALSRTLALRGRSAKAAALLKQFTTQSDYDLAVRQLRMRIRREPDRADLPARLGDLFAAHGDADAARAAWRQSLQIKPDQPALQKHLR